jgi:hypothetical protein
MAPRSAGAAPTTITSTEDLKSVTAIGSGIARDNLGGTHQVSFDVTWTGVGPVETTVNNPGSQRKQRTATETRQVTFDVVLVDGAANHRPGRRPSSASTLRSDGCRNLIWLNQAFLDGSASLV